MPSKVYFLPWKNIRLFEKWIAGTGAFNHIKERDFTALKIHFGEEGNTGFIKPEFARSVAAHVKAKSAWPFLTDASTIYVGQRADAVHHALVAEKHGFSAEKCGCPVIIADGLRGNAGIDVEVNLKHFKSVSIAHAIRSADSLIFLSHFKGHEISGFGGTLKNMGMGCGTKAGKYAMHDRVRPRIGVENCSGCGYCINWCSGRALKLKDKKIVFESKNCIGCGECILSCPNAVFSIPWDEAASGVQEKIVEYACGAVKDKPYFCINFVNFITKYCDCYATKGKPLVEDIGVFAGADPVALDQACADAVNKHYGRDFWADIFPGIDWRVQLEYAEKLGLGAREYELIQYRP